MNFIFIIIGAHVNCRTAEGMTPLHYATYGGHTECLRLLLAAKADVHATTRSVFTSLYSFLFLQNHPIPPLKGPSLLIYSACVFWLNNRIKC